MNKLMEILNKIKEDIKAFLQTFSGEKKELLALNEGQEDRVEWGNDRKSPQKEFRRSMNPMAEIDEAIERYNFLNEQGQEINQEIDDRRTGKNFEQYYIDSAKEGGDERPWAIIGFEDIFVDAYNEMRNVIIELYEQDPSIMEDEKKEELLERVKNSHCTGDTKTTILESLKDRVNKFKYIDKEKISEQEFIDGILESALDTMKLNKKLRTEIGAEKNSIRYVLLNSLDEEIDLPEELEGKYENIKDYKEKQKQMIIDEIDKVLDDGARTPGEKEAIRATVSKTILEKTAVRGNSNETLEMIESIITEEMEKGVLNPNATRYHHDWLNDVCKNIRKGSERISPNNKSNNRFITTNNEVLEGEKKEIEETAQENTHNQEPQQEDWVQ